MLLIFRDVMGRNLVTENSNLTNCKLYTLHASLTTDSAAKEFESLDELCSFLEIHGTNDYPHAIIGRIRNFFDYCFELQGQMGH